MNTKKMNQLVGESFEDLTIEKMRELQGAADATVDSTPLTTIVSIEVSKVVVSAASAISTMVVVSKIGNCK